MIVARRLAPSARPPPLQDIERVTEMLILGVILRRDLRASSHVNRVLSLCNGSLHALRVLRWHGLSAEALSAVTEATIISRLLYASPAWWGLTSAEDRARLESFSDTSSSRRRSGHLSQWRMRRTFACFGQWWHLTPMFSVSFSRLWQKELTICVLESILFFCLLRMIDILCQEYYLNDIYIFIYMISLQLMCIKKHLS